MIAKSRGNTIGFVYELLLADLQQGSFAPGEKLTTDGLARLYGVSRTPVREALGRLERDGLLVADPNAGFRVRTMTLRELCDMYEVREVLEGLAASKLAQAGASADLLGQLRACSRHRRESADIEVHKAEDRQFHQLICENCGSAALKALVRNYLILSIVFSVSDALVRERRNYVNCHDINLEHDEIIEAIEQRNSRLAGKRMSAHIATARKALERLI